MFAGSFPPNGWMFCSGQVLPISENETLFQLIGTTYGGDGQETFQLPDLQSRIPLHIGPNNQIGEAAGVESVTLTVQQIPVHTHPLTANTNTGTLADPGGNVHARSHTAGVFLYAANDAPDVNMAANAVTPAGGSQPHENLQPYLTISYIISLFGVFPSQT